MLRAVIFDFDGVVADTEPLHLRAFQSVLKQTAGVELSADDYYTRYVGLDDWGLARTLAEDWPHMRDASTSDLYALVGRKWAQYEQFISTDPVLFPGIADLLRDWSTHLPLAVASGARPQEIHTILGAAGLLDCFVAIVTTAEVRRGKPAPDIYLEALERINQAEGGRRKAEGDGHEDRIEAADVVAIEDSRWGLEAARAAGMRTIGVAGKSRATGAPPLQADLVVEVATCLDLTTLGGLVG